MRYEQALLAEVRYNGLVAMSLGITAFSLRNHLRTTGKEVGQIEIDEIYVGIDGVVQTQRDVMCAEKFPDLICRAVAAQCMSEQRIAMFDLTVQNGEISNAAP